jgi:hypothetical protein
MLKEMPLLRAPENRRTGIEIRPKVKCPDQTDDGIIPLVPLGINSSPFSPQFAETAQNWEFSAENTVGCTILRAGELKREARGNGVGDDYALGVVVGCEGS